MEVKSRAIEITGKIESQRQLILDEPIPVVDSTKVRVIIFLPEEAEIDEKEWLKSASVNPAFNFLNDLKEDIYTLEDGRPFNDKG